MTEDTTAPAPKKRRRIVKRRKARTPKPQGDPMPFPKKTAGASASLLTDLVGWANANATTPYELLAERFARDGWMQRLVETGVQPSYSGTTLVTFDLYVGKAIDALERFDQLTVAIAPGPGPISAAARMAARETVIFLLSGRLPAPMPKAATVQDPPPKPNGAAVPVAEETTIDMSDEHFGGEYVDEPPAAKAFNPVDHREPDGLPIFRDLYDIGTPEVKNTNEIVEAVLEEIASFLAGATSTEQVVALGAKNPDMMAFMVDVGTEADINELKGLVNKRRNELERPPGAVPRRRTAAAPRAN